MPILAALLRSRLALHLFNTSDEIHIVNELRSTKRLLQDGPVSCFVLVIGLANLARSQREGLIPMDLHGGSRCAIVRCGNRDQETTLARVAPATRA